jgi:hypothetical protein
MAVSASQLQNLLKEAFPSDPAQMRVTDIMVPSGRTRTVDEVVGYGESGPIYGSRQEPEMVVGGYYSPALGRALTAEESRYLIPITQYVDGQGQVTTGMVFPGESGIKAIDRLGLDPSKMGGQATPQGFEIYPVTGIPTDQGERTNIALSYGGSGGPETRAYQTSTLTGNANLDKIVDQLAKAANAALLTYVSGQALGAIGGDLFGAVAGDPTRAALYGNAGYGEGLLNMAPPPVISEPVLVPGDTALTGTLAQPPLAVENIAGQLTPEATAMLGPSAGAIAAGDLAAIEASMGTPSATGSATKAALLGDAGYGSIDAPIYDASVPTEALPKGAEPSVLKGAGDIVKYTPGALRQYATTALTTLGLDPDLVNNIVGWNQSNETTTQTQTGSGSNFLGPIIGGLLSRQQQGAPTPGIIQGKGVDITSPIQSLLAPKLVQQRPVTLL